MASLVPTRGSAVEKSVVKGGKGGTPWTIGYNRGGLERLVVSSTAYGIKSVKKCSDLAEDLLERKLESGHSLPLNMKDEEEFLVSVEGWYDSSNIMRNLIFKTNKNPDGKLPEGLREFGRTFQAGNTKFILQSQGKKIIGFYGFSRNPVDSQSPKNQHIVSIGAYYIPISTTPPPPEIKLGGYGGDGSWDDGLFDGVKKVYVGRRQVQAGHDVIAAVKFVYHKGAKDVETVHGKPTAMEYEAPFELDYPSEYITAVDGTYDKIVGNKIEVITMLRLTTNKKKSDAFGREAGTSFTLQEDGHKIVGFHGLTGNVLHEIGVHGVKGNLLHKIGVHVLPIPNNPK